MFEGMPRDVRLLIGSRGIRAFAFSYLNVVFAIYLDSLGFSAIVVGMVFSVAYLSGALLTAVWGYLSDRYGRTHILVLLAVLTIVSSGIYLFFTHIAFILLAVAIANVGAGGSGGGGQGGGPFNPVEQALLAEKCAPERRNHVFAINAFVGSIMGSLGALVSGLPQHLQEAWGWSPASSFKPLFALTLLFSLLLIFVYRAIAEEPRPRAETKRPMSRRSGAFVTKLSLLGFVDNFGAGLISPLLSYWFFLRYGVELKTLGILFFVSYLLAAVSFLAAPVIARRIGIVKTMFLSHAAASSLYFFLPFAPTLYVAGTILALRSLLAYMDNPLRESFTMAMVKSRERGSAAGVTQLARAVPFGISPTLTGYMMQSLSLNVPLLLGATLQLANDFCFYHLFRHVRTPEEERAQAAAQAEGA